MSSTYKYYYFLSLNDHCVLTLHHYIWEAATMFLSEQWTQDNLPRDIYGAGEHSPSIWCCFPRPHITPPGVSLMTHCMGLKLSLWLSDVICGSVHSDVQWIVQTTQGNVPTGRLVYASYVGNVAMQRLDFSHMTILNRPVMFNHAHARW